MLTKSDHICIFFTKNAKTIDMTEIADHGEAELDMIEVPAGKQSTDIHIGSFLGYLVGKYSVDDKIENCSVVIVSKDTDYDNVIKFWEKKTGIKASKALKIKETTSTTKTSTKNKTKNEVTKQTTDIQTKKIKVDGAKKTKLNQEVMQILRAQGFDASIGNAVAKLVTGVYGQEKFMNDVHNMLRGKYDNYLEIYEAIKPVISKYSDDIASTQSENCSENNQIQQLLSKANYENDIVNYVASVVTKNVGIKNGKQQIYRTIISKYGQSKGLKIYNHIKKHI